MIDWANVAANSLWILGCAIALAALSYASWEASELKEKMGAVMRRPSYQAAFSLAGMLFCLGLAGTSSLTVQRILWLFLAALFAGLLVYSIRLSRKKI